MTQTITRDRVARKQPIPDGYDWRNEPWVDDSKIRELSIYIANHVILAMNADGDNEEDTEDEQVLALLNPHITERICKSEMAHEVINYRLACAAGIGIDKLITKWMETLGSIDSPGMPPRTKTRSDA